MRNWVTIASCQLPDVREDIEQSLNYIIEYAEKAGAQGADLVCFPECFLQGYIFDERTCKLAIHLSSPIYQEILDRLAIISLELIIGIIETEYSLIFNTAVVVKQVPLLEEGLLIQEIETNDRIPKKSKT